METKKVYQFTVDVWNYTEGTHTHGVFPDHKTAEKFMNETVGQEKSLEGSMGNAMHRIWVENFDVGEKFDAIGDWLGDHQVNGRD